MTSDDPRPPRHQGHPPRPPAADPGGGNAAGPGGDGPEPSDVDELASALIDGALPPDQAAAARARPEVLARATAMDAARSAIRSVAPLAHEARERAIAAALSSFDVAGAPPEGAGTPAGGAVPTTLAARRPSRAGHGARRPRATRWLGAAAVAALLAGVAGLIAVSDREDDDTAGQSVGSSPEESAEPTTADGAGEGTAESPDVDTGAGGDAEAQTDDGAMSGPARERAAVEAGDLGAFASDDDLVRGVAASLPSGGSAVEPGAAPSGPPQADRGGCAAAVLPPPLDHPDTMVRLHGHATVGGSPVEVWVVTTSAGARVVALDAACAVVIDRPLG
jgi:hypothetical protein